MAISIELKVYCPMFVLNWAFVAPLDTEHRSTGVIWQLKVIEQIEGSTVAAKGVNKS